MYQRPLLVFTRIRCAVYPLLAILLAFQTEAKDLPICKESDYHYEYTECDVLGSRWRVALPNKPSTCTGLPDPAKGTQCTFSCNTGEFLDMKTQECQKCAAGTYSLGTGVAFDEWDSMPPGFLSHGINLEAGDVQMNCSNSAWTPKGAFIASSTDECTSTLAYAISLKKPGSVSFQYLYPDNSIFFEFYVQNDQCQSSEEQSRWMKSTKNDWDTHYVQLSRGNNVLYWRTTGFSLNSNSVKPVLLRNIAISGVAYTSECFPCKAGTYAPEPGASRCAPCAANAYSRKGATVCQECEKEKYAGIGSGECLTRPPCNESDYFYTHTPCDSNRMTQLMYKWIEPKICSETADGAVQLPASGQMQTCPPCNPGFFVNNGSACEPCPHGFYSNGTVCTECSAGTEPVMGFEYKWWNRMPSNMKSSVYSNEYSDSERTTAWEVAGEYVYTTPGDMDTGYMMLTLTVPGYRLPHDASKQVEANKELAQISFVFETKCDADCVLFFMAGLSERNNFVVESWRGTNGKQSYSYIVKSNSTVSFTWGFQRNAVRTVEKQYNADFAKIYVVHITNVIDGVASQCRHCAQGEESACVSCPPGHYMLEGTGVCKACPANSIVHAEHQVGPEACVRCGPNTHSNKAHTACLSDCRLAVKQSDGESLHYDFSLLSSVATVQNSPRFTSRGLKYFQQFSIGLCGGEDRAMATCVDNVTESRKESSGYVCQSTIVPSDVRGQSVVSSQPFSVGDSLIGVTTESAVDSISSPENNFPTNTRLPDVIFYYRGSETTQACKEGRYTTIRLRCDPSAAGNDLIAFPSKCSEGTCDGCSFHLLWQSRHACPPCSERHYKKIESKCLQGIMRTTYVWQQSLLCFGGVTLPSQTVSACVTLDFWLKFGVSIGSVAALLLITISCYFWKKTRKLEYKYSKLMVTAGERECELPAADSCAIMEGEDAEDDLIYLTKKSFFGKIKSFSRERTSDGFDTVPLKSSSGLEMEMS
ncbi:endosome/lysosome-associated apoptosis and autophagy regulator 1 [Clupea harengus]|uniref:Endosome/lysosome-associated apoptosis and autophagy regulator 1 n=1 Tax=Clupea harengus TaxID=7950 RepID=A0A6P8F2W8_CLUHA|nr:endosome/lysosome-associated apoptosis and autophagy regulator 1 [Clupea harengus]